MSAGLAGGSASVEGAPGQGVLDESVRLAEEGDVRAAQALLKDACGCAAPEAALRLGKLLASRGQTVSAEAAYRVADEAGSAEGAFELGGILYGRGDLADAKAAYRRADERGLAEGAVNHGWVLAQQGNAREAELAYRRADERGSAVGAYNLGFQLQQRGDLIGAEAAYRRADERGMPAAVAGLISVLVQQAERESAEQVYRRVIDGPDTGRPFVAACALAAALRELNMPRAAEPPARHAVTLDPRSPRARRELAAILTMQGRCEEAEEELRAAIDSEPADGPVTGSEPPEHQRQDPEPETAASQPRARRPRPAFGVPWPKRSADHNLQPQTGDPGAAALESLKKLGEALTYGYARMLAGHPVTDLPVKKELAERLAIELWPMLDRGDAYRPNFGEIGSLLIIGDLSQEVKIEARYLDSSIREDRYGKTVSDHPRDIRMTAHSSPPFTAASSLDFRVVHGRPTPAIVMPDVSTAVTTSGQPPWPQARSAGHADPAGASLGCTSPGCPRATVGSSETCLAHIDPSTREQALAEHVGLIDAREMPISTELLRLILKGPLVRPIRFDGAIFQAIADFSNLLFIAPVSFDFASFDGTALFTRSVFTNVTTFSGAVFSSDANFDRARFHGAALLDAVKFRGSASFEACTFHGGGSFSNSQFSGQAVFNGCRFQTDVHSVFTRYLSDTATFSGAVFSEVPEFSPTLVAGVCSFDGARFESEMLVDFNVTCSAISFVDTELVGGAALMLSPCDVILDGANFGDVSTLATSRVTYFAESGASFHGDAWARVRLVSARDARIGLLQLEDVDLRACRFDRAHGLETARIEGSEVFARPPRGLRVHRPVTADEWSWRAYRRRGGPRLAQHGPAITMTLPSGSHGWAVIPKECEPPDLLADAPGPISRRKIMAIYHDLRVARENMRDQLNAADFYYSEMQMRGERDHSSVLNAETSRSWVELILLRIFWMVSGYDVRPARSLASYILTVAACTVVLWQWGYRTGTTLGHAGITALSSATAVFGAVDWNVLNSLGQLTEIFLRVAGPILLALTALGIRARARR